MQGMKERTQRRGLAAFATILASALLVVFAAGASAQQQVGVMTSSAPTAAVNATAPVAAAKAPPLAGAVPFPPLAPASAAAPVELGSVQATKPGDEGIKMHGRWEITVKNPDGTVAEHRDFENAIQGGGAAYLIALMAGYTVPSDYEVFLQSTGTVPCTPPTNGLAGCVLVRSLTTSPATNSCPYYYCAATLSYTYNLNYSVLASNSMVLSGYFTANRAGTIDSVSTYAGDCPIQFIQSSVLTTTSPAACNAAAGGIGVNALTGTGITAITVTNGQLVQVIVTISFS